MSITQNIAAFPAAPSRSQDPDTFNTNVDATMARLGSLPTEMNAFGTQANALADDVSAKKLYVENAYISAASAGQSASDAAASAAAALAYKESALSAWLNSMAPAEVLPAIAQQFHYGAIVAMCQGDTTEFRAQCQDKSWYQEAICTGAWRGQRANEAACRAVSGATTGDYYQNTTDGKYYTLSAGSGQTEVFRGNKRDIPARPIFAAEAGRVVIYDGDTVGLPMWKVMKAGAVWNSTLFIASITSVAWGGNTLFVGTTGSGSGVVAVEFAKDSSFCWTSYSNYGGRNSAGLALCNSAGNTFCAGSGSYSPQIVSTNVNAVAATVLPGAPVDPDSGLKIPTIAVATTGGACIINNDAGVTNKTLTSCGAYNVGFTPDKKLWANFYVTAGPTATVWCLYPDLTATSSAPSNVHWDSAYGSSNDVLGAAARYGVPIGSQLAVGSASGVTLIGGRSTRLAAGGMVAYITKDYPGAWQVGDSKRLWLCDATAETVTGGTQPDRSVKNKPITVVGSLTKTLVGGVAMYSGFSAANYLEEAYSSDLDFGTGDFCVMGWVKASTSGGCVLHRAAYSGGYSGAAILVSFSSDRVWFRITDDGYATSDSFTGSRDILDDSPHFFVCTRVGALLSIYTDGTLDSTQAVSAADGSLSNASAKTRLGLDCSGGNSFANGGISLVRLSTTVPSAAQIAQIYRDELKLFQTGASGTLAGSSSAVVSVGYSKKTGLAHITSATHHSYFSGLTRVGSEASPTGVGTITTVSADGDVVLTGGSTGAYASAPAISLREAIEGSFQRVIEQPVVKDFDAFAFTATTVSGSASITSVSVTSGTPTVGTIVTGSGIPAGAYIAGINGTTYTLSANATASASGVTIGQASFDLDPGYTALSAKSAGSLKREGSTKDWTRAFNGTFESVVFATSPGGAAWVQIEMIRSAS